MPRPRRVSSSLPRRIPSENPNGLQTRLELLTYAFSRLPPRQLPFLAIYAYVILYSCNRGWLSREVMGKGGAAVVSVLSMVTGLLLSYRFSSAVSKWDEGKKVWVGVRSAIREGIRLLSLSTGPASMASPSMTSSSPVDLGEVSPVEEEISRTKEDVAVADMSNRSDSLISSTPSKGKSKTENAGDRMNELSGLLVGFAFALQHHLHGSRPLPQAPLCDLLPLAYLSSLKRTEARVRFADPPAGPSGSSSISLSEAAADYRPGLSRRGTGPPTKDERSIAGDRDDDWDLGNLREKAGETVGKLADAVGGLGDDGIDLELRQQLSQLNLPSQEVPRQESLRTKSNLHSPHPPNLPLALLRLMEAYAIGLAEIPPERGGWSDSNRERALGVIKALADHLGEAERLSSNPPPLPLTLHLSHLLLIYLAALPCSLLCVVNGWSVIFITLIAGWCLLGLEALIGEVGGVFGVSENHHPLPRMTQEILVESLDISPVFMRCYRARLVARLGADDVEVADLDRRNTRTGEEWMPSFG